MKKTNMDLIVGGSIILALFILVAGVLWLKEATLTRKLVAYTVLFPNVGTLQVGDPVSVNGVSKGSVKSINLRGERVAVEINMDRDVPLTDSCRIVVMNIGLMGERGVGILLTSNGTFVKPTAKKDTMFLYGSFDSGIAEAMGMLGNVLGDVEVLATNVSSIVNSTVGDTAFLNLFHTMVGRLDTLTAVAEKIVVKNQPAIDRSIQNVSVASTNLRALLDRNEHNIDSIMNNGAALSSYALTLVGRVDTLTMSVQQIVSEVQNGKGSLGMLVKDETFYIDLKKTVSDLDTLVNQVQDDALKLRVKLGFGKRGKKNRL